jgi:hypothetical protein
MGNLLKQTEKDIIKQITDWLDYKHYFWWYVPNRGRWDKGQDKCTPGAPDICVMVDGKLIAIEVKSPTGRQTKAQELFQFNLEAVGGKYLIARSIDDLINQGV